MINFLLPPGFSDEISKNASIEHKYKNKIINLFQLNGYELVKPPLIEYANVYNQDKNFVFKEKKEKKNYIIRDDITMQVARIANSRLKHKHRPLKLCYYGEVVRKKGSMLRPERQFLQVGAECIGEKNCNADVEMLDLAYQALKIVGIKDISIDICSTEFLNTLFKKINNSKNIDLIKSSIRKKDLKNCLQNIESSLHKYIEDLFLCNGNLEEKKNILKKIVFDKNTDLAKDNLLSIYSKFKKKYPEVNFFIDLIESNYLEYHTGSSFTFYAKNVRGEIARGGRYLSRGNNNSESSTGFTCYMDSIIRASSKIEKVKKILVPFNVNEKIRKKLINNNFIIETLLNNKKEIKKTAIEKKMEYCLVKNKIVNLKKE